MVSANEIGLSYESLKKIAISMSSTCAYNLTSSNVYIPQINNEAASAKTLAITPANIIIYINAFLTPLTCVMVGTFNQPAAVVLLSQ